VVREPTGTTVTVPLFFPSEKFPATFTPLGV